MKWIRKILKLPLTSPFGCKWERISNPPRWVSYRAQYFNHETINQIKGKSFIYKIVKEQPMIQGDNPTKFYRRLRYIAWKKGNK